MASTFNSQAALAEQALVQLLTDTVYIPNSHRDYENIFVNWVTDTKGTVKVRLPNNYTVNHVVDITAIPGEVKERYVEFNVDQISNVVVNLSQFERQFEIAKNTKKRIHDPAAENIGLDVDYYCAQQLFYNSYFHIGTAGTKISAFSSLADTAAFMNNVAIPQSMRVGVLAEDQYSSLSANVNLQNSNAVDITKDITRRWQIGNLADINLFHNPAVIRHIAGVGEVGETPANGKVAAGQVKTAVSSGTSMVVKGLGVSTSGVFLKGDKITIKGRYALHPRTKQQFGHEFQVTVTDTQVDSDSGGEATVNFLPEIVTTGANQNIDAEIPIDADLILATANTGVGSTTKIPYTANVFFHRSALLFAAPKLPNIFREDTFATESGVSVRTSSHGNILTAANITRMDVGYGTEIVGDRSLIYLG